MTQYKRKEKIGGCTLYLGDSLEILPGLEPVDLVVTDPPYKLEAGGNTTNGLSGGKFAHGNYDNSGDIVPCDIEWAEFMPLISKAVKRGHIYIMCNNRHVGTMLKEAEAAGMKFHNLLVWDKISPTPNRWYMKNCEFVGMFFKGKAKHINDCGSKQLIRVPLVNDDRHPTVKPIELMQHYIQNSSKPQEVVLDPFMGSGTTGVACVKSGRRFIGIEKDETYFDLACERIRQALETPSTYDWLADA